MMARRYLGLVIGVAAVACTPKLDQPSEVKSLRVLAVQKSKPYAQPGDTVTLTMLDADGSSDAPRPVNRLWIRGCENPPGDLYAGCFLQFAEKMPADDPGAAAKFFAENVQAGPLAQSSVTISDDIISGRPPPTDPKAPRYGLAYEFFAICAGAFGLIPGADPTVFPIGCFEADAASTPLLLDTTGHARLGQDDFVVGYSTVFVYENLTNNNPSFVRFEVEGAAIEEDCRGLGCIDLEPPPPAAGLDGGGGDAGAGSGDAGVGDAGAPSGGAPDAGTSRPSGPPPLGDDCDLADPRCIVICTKDDRDTCPPIKVRAYVDSRSQEEDAVLAASGREGVKEQMWLNYYVDQGSIAPAVKLLGDATKGWNDEHGTDFRAPSEPGPVRIWGVAHDNRGGVQWIRASLYARRP